MELYLRLELFCNLLLFTSTSLLWYRLTMQNVRILKIYYLKSLVCINLCMLTISLSSDDKLVNMDWGSLHLMVTYPFCTWSVYDTLRSGLVLAKKCYIVHQYIITAVKLGLKWAPHFKCLQKNLFLHCNLG